MRCPLYMLLAGLLSACTAATVGAPVGDQSARPARNPDFHTVRQGDTLYSVAFLYGYQIEELALWNELSPPYTIYKGQRLRLKPPPARSVPHARPKPKATQTRVSPSQPKPQRVAASRPKTASPPPHRRRPTQAKAPPQQAPAPAQPHSQWANRPLTWSWPADGPLLQRFDASSSGKKGVSIGGKSGAPVRAAAAGKVVYSGSGLGGYGRLIIIKHNNDFLSAYAHNRTLIAGEGQWVEQDQVIAEMGNSGTNRVQLYFEIRKQGRPVDPLQYLPRH
jgi:lipoprotein NlpD